MIGATVSRDASTQVEGEICEIDHEFAQVGTHTVRVNLHELVVKKGGAGHLPESARREKSILRYIPWVRLIARGLVGRLLPYGVDLEDLVNAGVIGLIDAMKRFDPSRKIRFETYAEFRVRGAIQDELRSQDWASKHLRGHMNLLVSTSARLEQKLGRAVEDEEMAQALEMSLERLHHLVQWSKICFMSLDDFVEDGGRKRRPLWETLPGSSEEEPLAQVSANELKEILAEEVEKLPPRERAVIHLYYAEGLSMKEIGKILGVGEPRVSQLHAQAVQGLRRSLAARLKEE